MRGAGKGSPAGYGIVWKPDPEVAGEANLTAFMRALDVPDYGTLVRRSNEEPAWFHEALIEFLGLRFYEPYDQVVDESRGAPWVRWCIGGTTNVVLNCVDRWLERHHPGPALIWEGEDGEVREFSLADLDAEMRRLAHGLRELGLGAGDVVGIFLPNIPQAAFALLAVARIGAVALPLFSGFGADALASRLADAGAAAVITVDGASRRGRVAGVKCVVDEAAARVPTLRHVIVCRHRDAPMGWEDGRDVWWHDMAGGTADDCPITAVDAEAPLFLIYTSGTTGRPKGVVHTHCGFSLKISMDMGILMDLSPGDRILWMSDMGWLVGPMLVFGGLLVGATIVLAEGAPDWPDIGRMWHLVERHAVSWLGIAPTVVRAMMPHGTEPLRAHDLSSLRVLASTGEPWNPEAWLWLFENAGGRRLPLLNYSGGTEMGGIVCSTLLHPMKPCSFSGPVPGTGADVVDAEGNPVPSGQIGELVMRRPSVGLTRGLWHDEERYLAAYWQVIPGMWVQGDLASIDEDGLWYLHGRSDDTLKIAGKRTGPAEIEALLLATGLVVDAAAVGIPDPVKGTAIVCVCVPSTGAPAPDACDRLTAAVVSGLGPPFRPRSVLLVPALPRTRNMKVMKRVVRAVLLGEDPGDLTSLVNPECLEPLQQAARSGT